MSVENTVDRAYRQIGQTLRIVPLRTPTLPPATHTNAVVLGAEEAVLIEPASPYPDEIERLSDTLADLRQREGVRVTAILCTHHHRDHVGGAMAAREALGVPLLAHSLTRDLLEGAVVFDEVLSDGQALRLSGSVGCTVTAVHTPGHAPGHLCFVDSVSGWIVAGDMVASVGTILIDPSDGDMAAYLASLDLLRTKSPKGLVPAHGEPIEDADHCLSRYIAHRLARERKVVDALEQLGESATVEALVPLAYDDVPRATHPIAARSVLAHLEKLVREGMVARQGDRYRRA